MAGVAFEGPPTTHGMIPPNRINGGRYELRNLTWCCLREPPPIFPKEPNVCNFRSKILPRGRPGEEPPRNRMSYAFFLVPLAMFSGMLLMGRPGDVRPPSLPELHLLTNFNGSFTILLKKILRGCPERPAHPPPRNKCSCATNGPFP